jgi:hypothetical protein
MLSRLPFATGQIVANDTYDSRPVQLAGLQYLWVFHLPDNGTKPKGEHATSKDEMADCLESYAAKMELPVRNGVKVERVMRATDGRDGYVCGH